MNIKNIKSKPSALLSATREWMPISKIENICMSSANCILRAQLHVGHGTGPVTIYRGQKNNNKEIGYLLNLHKKKGLMARG